MADPIRTKQAMERAIRALEQKKLDDRFQGERELLLSTVGKDLADIMSPILVQIVENSKLTKEEFQGLVQSIVEASNPIINVSAPEVKVDVPKIDVPEVIVNIPKIEVPKIPPIKVPKPEVTVKAPIVNIPDIVMPDQMDIKGFIGLMGYDKGLLEDPIPVQLRGPDGTPLDLLGGLTQVISSGGGGGARIVKVSDINLSAYTNSDNRVQVSVETGGSGLTDNELRAASVPVEQVSGSTWSVSVVDALPTGTNNIGDVDIVTGQTGVAADQGETDVRTLRVVHAGDAAVSVSVNDGTVTVTGITDSTTAVIGDKAADEADGDSNPIKIGGVARTANPTAVANGDRVSASYDDVGRQLIRPIQVRDAVATSYITEDEVREISLLAGVSGEFHDLLWIIGANESDAAINLDFRGSTGGTVMMSLEIPANGTAGIAPVVPYRQAETDSAWTVQNSASDNSNTNYSITALFSKEV